MKYSSEQDGEWRLYPVKTKFYTDLNVFYQHVISFLLNHEAENNLLLGILNTLKKDIATYSKENPPIFISVESEDMIELVSIRTPPYNQLISYTKDLKMIDRLVEELNRKKMKVPGVLGFKEGALRFAEKWCELHSLEFKLEVNERIYRLEQVNPETLGTNQVELATDEDETIILEMSKGFFFEALPEEAIEVTDLEASQQRMKKSLQDKMIFVLKVGGQIVSMVKQGHHTPNGQIISAVYTPPQKRRKGYATELVAKVSQKTLSKGKKYCFLFTDLSNPTSNKIYQTIGYRPVTDMDLYRFHERK